jgi:hypothetical protein
MNPRFHFRICINCTRVETNSAERRDMCVLGYTLSICDVVLVLNMQEDDNHDEEGRKETIIRGLFVLR